MGDAVNGFKYEGENLTAKKYVNMENKEYYDHKDGVDLMVSTSYGMNMSINNFDKRRINATPQETEFHVCKGHIRNINGQEITQTELDRIWSNKEQFGLIFYLNQKDFDLNPDMETDLKMWMNESQNILNIPQYDEQEKIKHLPKKDFKIDFKGDVHAILKNCKFAKLMSTTRDKRGRIPVSSFAIIIERLIYTRK